MCCLNGGCGAQFKNDQWEWLSATDQSRTLEVRAPEPPPAADPPAERGLGQPAIEPEDLSSWTTAHLNSYWQQIRKDMQRDLNHYNRLGERQGVQD